MVEEKLESGTMPLNTLVMLKVSGKKSSDGGGVAGGVTRVRWEA